MIVAHRIKTIVDCDRVLVFDHGRLAEVGAPQELLRNAASMFHSLANSSSSDAELL